MFPLTLTRFPLIDLFFFFFFFLPTNQPPYRPTTVVYRSVMYLLSLKVNEAGKCSVALCGCVSVEMKCWGKTLGLWSLIVLQKD